MREIEKCTVFCSNCHRKYHYNEDKKTMRHENTFTKEG